jgi:hypothetical protein
MNAQPFDPELYRVRSDEAAATATTTGDGGFNRPQAGEDGRRKKRLIAGSFIRGPIPLEWVSKVCRLSPAAIRVALAVLYITSRSGSGVGQLTTAVCKQFNVSRTGKWRGLVELEDAGLIAIERRPHQNPHVKLGS